MSLNLPALVALLGFGFATPVLAADLIIPDGLHPLVRGHGYRLHSYAARPPVVVVVPQVTVVVPPAASPPVVVVEPSPVPAPAPRVVMPAGGGDIIINNNGGTVNINPGGWSLWPWTWSYDPGPSYDDLPFTAAELMQRCPGLTLEQQAQIMEKFRSRYTFRHRTEIWDDWRAGDYAAACRRLGLPDYA